MSQQSQGTTGCGANSFPMLGPYFLKFISCSFKSSHSQNQFWLLKNLKWEFLNSATQSIKHPWIYKTEQVYCQHLPKAFESVTQTKMIVTVLSPAVKSTRLRPSLAPGKILKPLNLNRKDTWSARQVLKPATLIRADLIPTD